MCRPLLSSTVWNCKIACLTVPLSKLFWILSASLELLSVISSNVLFAVTASLLMFFWVRNLHKASGRNRHFHKNVYKYNCLRNLIFKLHFIFHGKGMRETIPCIDLFNIFTESRYIIWLPNFASIPKFYQKMLYGSYFWFFFCYMAITSFNLGFFPISYTVYTCL